MLPKAVVNSIRRQAKVFSLGPDSALYVFQPAEFGLSFPTTPYAVARVVDHEGWAFPAEDYDTACQMVEGISLDERVGFSRAYKYNEV